MSNRLSLSGALAELRDELRNARLQADPDLKLNVTGIELELALEVRTDVNSEVGGGFWQVVTAGASAGRGSEKTHRLTMTIEPTFMDDAGSETELAVSPFRPMPDST